MLKEHKKTHLLSDHNTKNTKNQVMQYMYLWVCVLYWTRGGELLGTLSIKFTKDVSDFGKYSALLL